MTTRRLLLWLGNIGFAVVAALCLPSIVGGASPSWWISRGVINTNATPDDYSLVNQGQVKNMATNASAEMQANLPGGAGSNVVALVSSFSTTNNYLPTNVGQLKSVAKPFYDRLIAVGYTNVYPWAGNTATNDFATANIGQLKNLFNWDITKDSVGDGIPDWWQLLYYGTITTNSFSCASCVATNPWAHGLSNLQLYQNPSVLIADNYSSIGDGIPDWWRLLYFGTTTTNNQSCATCNPNADGYNNLEEYLNGTNPNMTNLPPVFIINDSSPYTTGLNIPVQAMSTNYPNFLVRLDTLSSNATLFANTGSPVTYTLPDEGDGVYGVYAQYADANGNPASPPFIQSVILNRQAPVIAITAPATNALLDQAFMTLVATAYDPGAMRPNTTGPLQIWINDQSYWDRAGTNIVVERFPVPSGTNSFTVTIRAVNATGHTNAVSRTWTVDPSGDTVAPQLTNFNIAATLLLPDVGEIWVEATADDSNAVVNAIVNADDGVVTTNSLHVSGTQIEGLVPLEFGTNAVVISARDAAGNTTSNVFTLIRSNHYRFEITSPAFGNFATVLSNYVSGYVSALFDEGLPTQTNVTSVLINGVAAVLGTNIDANGNLSFTTTNAIGLGVPITGVIGGPGIPTTPPPDPPAMSREYEVTAKETGGESIDAGEGGDRFNLYWNTVSNCWNAGLFRQVITRDYTANTNGWQMHGVNESGDQPSPPCLTVLNPDQIPWLSSGSSTFSDSSSDPIDRSLSFGIQSYVHGDGREADVVAHYPFTDPCTFQNISFPLRALTRERDTGYLTVRVPRQYDTNTTVVFTFEGVDYALPDGATQDLSQVKFRGQSPVAYSNEIGSVSYLTTVNGGQKYTLNQDDFQWPASSVFSQYVTSSSDTTDSCPITKSFLRAGNYTTDMHWLSWTNFHNAHPEIDIVGMEQNAKRDPGGLVVCNCDSNGPPRAEVTIQHLTNANVNVSLVLTIPTQIKVFTTSNNVTEVTSGAVFSNSQLPTNLWVEGESASTNMRDVKLTVSLSSATNVSDYVNFTMLWSDISLKTSSSDTIDTGNDASDLVNHNWPTTTTALGGGNNLGAIDCLGNTNLAYAYAIGKMQAKAVLEPPGIEAVIITGWHMRRHVSYIAWTNAVIAAADTRDFVLEDFSDSYFLDVNPTSGTSTREIYDLDAPACPIFGGTNITHTSEVYDNFKENASVTIAGVETRCSLYAPWSYTVQIDVDKSSGKVEINSITQSLIMLPTNPHYSHQ